MSISLLFLKSIEFCLNSEKISGKELNRIAYTTSEDIGLLTKAQISTEFSLKDYHDYYGTRFYGKKEKGEDIIFGLGMTQSLIKQATFLTFPI